MFYSSNSHAGGATNGNAVADKKNIIDILSVLKKSKDPKTAVARLKVILPPTLYLCGQCEAPYEKVAYSGSGMDYEYDYGCSLPDSEIARLSCPSGWAHDPSFNRPDRYYCASGGGNPYDIETLISLYSQIQTS